MIYDFLDPKDIPTSWVSFWQSPIWKSILLDSHQAREVFYYGNIQGTWMLLEIRALHFWQFWAFSLGVVQEQVWDDYIQFMDGLCRVLRKKRVIFFQIEPIKSSRLKALSRKSKMSYKNFFIPYTRVIYLKQSEEDILRQMHEKGRYNIRLAGKRWVVVDFAEPTEENIDIWMSLLSDTTERDGFSSNSRQYYESFLALLKKDNNGWLYFARFGNRAIAAGIFVFTHSRAIYYYWASSSEREDRKHMAPYLLQWTAILEAKRRNIPVYDFLWVADPDNPNDHLQWVTYFKEKFGGELIQLPEKILVPLSLKYAILKLIRFLLRK